MYFLRARSMCCDSKLVCVFAHCRLHPLLHVFNSPFASVLFRFYFFLSVFVRFNVYFNWMAMAAQWCAVDTLCCHFLSRIISHLCKYNTCGVRARIRICVQFNAYSLFAAIYRYVKYRNFGVAIRRHTIIKLNRKLKMRTSENNTI